MAQEQKEEEIDNDFFDYLDALVSDDDDETALAKMSQYQGSVIGADLFLTDDTAQQENTPNA